MFSFNRRQTAPRKPEAPVAGYKPGFAIEYFRSRPDLVKYAADLLRTPEFRDMLSVLHHELPLDSIQSVIAHKRVLRLIEIMATAPNQSNDELESTYGSEKEFPLTAETNQQQE